MKIRSGFVSNSSSSSFVVERGNNISASELKLFITPEQEEILLKFGFRKTYIRSPYQVPCTEEEWKKVQKEFDKLSKKKLTKKDYAKYKKSNISADEADKIEKNFTELYTLCYDVSCNQDEVIRFLIKNKIRFEASVHYSHYTYMYFPEEDKLIIATNFGNIISMYTSDIDLYVDNKFKKNRVEIKTGKEYLKYTDWWDKIGTY